MNSRFTCLLQSGPWQPNSRATDRPGFSPRHGPFGARFRRLNRGSEKSGPAIEPSRRGERLSRNGRNDSSSLVKVGRDNWNMQSERMLVIQAQARDSDAFRQLVTRYERRLIYYIRRMLGNETGALDVMQDVWLLVFRRLGSLSAPEAFRVWLYKIAHDVTVSHLRIRSNHQKQLIQEEALSQDLETWDEFEAMENVEPTFRTSRRHFLSITPELIEGRIRLLPEGSGRRARSYPGCAAPLPRQGFFASSHAQAMSDPPVELPAPRLTETALT